MRQIQRWGIGAGLLGLLWLVKRASANVYQTFHSSKPGSKVVVEGKYSAGGVGGYRPTPDAWVVTYPMPGGATGAVWMVGPKPVGAIEGTKVSVRGTHATGKFAMPGAAPSGDIDSHYVVVEDAAVLYG